MERRPRYSLRALIVEQFMAGASMRELARQWALPLGMVESLIRITFTGKASA